MTRAKDREILRLTRLLEAERERADKAWDSYRSTLYELVEVKLQLDEIRAICIGQTVQVDTQPQVYSIVRNP